MIMTIVFLQAIQILCFHYLFRSRFLLGHSLHLEITMYIDTDIHEWTWAEKFSPTIMLVWAKNPNVIELLKIIVLRVAWKSGGFPV